MHRKKTNLNTDDKKRGAPKWRASAQYPQGDSNLYRKNRNL